jgi:hypothetical protein
MTRITNRFMTEYTTGQFFATDNLAAISNLNGGRSEQNRSTGNGAKNYQKHLSKMLDKDFEVELFVDLLAFLLAGGGQQVVGHVHEQAQIAGGMFAQRLDQ